MKKKGDLVEVSFTGVVGEVFDDGAVRVAPDDLTMDEVTVPAEHLTRIMPKPREGQVWQLDGRLFFIRRDDETLRFVPEKGGDPELGFPVHRAELVFDPGVER